MKLDIQPLPVKTVIDYPAIVDIVRRDGAMLVPADSNQNAMHVALLKFGISVYAIKIGGSIVAYSVEPSRRVRK